MTGITSPLVLWGLVGITLALLVLVVLGWGRLSGTGPVPVAGRVGALLTTNVLVVLCLLVGLNDQFLFFSSWADLVGASTEVTSSTQAGGSAAAAMAAPLPADAAGSITRTRVVAPAAPSAVSPDGRVATYTVSGAASGVTTSVDVILPPGYSPTATTRYPVIEAFGGYPGNEASFARNFGLPGTTDALAAARATAPAIWVLPNTEVPAGVDTECVNGPSGTPQMETFLAADVPLWVSQHFRVQHGRTAWATMGYSAGAWCASLLAMDHPARYAAAVSIAGYYSVEWGNWAPYAPGSPELARLDLIERARTAPPPVALWAYTSRGDQLSFPSTHALARAARAPLSVRTVVASAGGHRISEWLPAVQSGLTWLGQTVPGFMPGTA